MKKRKLRKIRLICFVFLLVFTIALVHHINTEKVVYTSVCKYVVEKEDTLWDIAHSYNFSNQDVRQLIYDIQQMNKIDCDIYPGQLILIPVNNEAMVKNTQSDNLVASSN